MDIAFALEIERLQQEWGGGKKEVAEVVALAPVGQPMPGPVVLAKEHTKPTAIGEGDKPPRQQNGESPQVIGEMPTLEAKPVQQSGELHVPQQIPQQPVQRPEILVQGETLPKHGILYGMEPLRHMSKGGQTGEHKPQQDPSSFLFLAHETKPQHRHSGIEQREGLDLQLDGTLPLFDNLRMRDEKGRSQEDGGIKVLSQGEVNWLAALDTLPIIAQSNSSVMSLFQPTAPVQSVQTAHPVVAQAEDIVMKLIERTELGPLQTPREISNVQLALDRSIFGISGIGLSVTQGSVAVVLIGMQNPDTEKLAAAGQVLVRELQRHFPNRSVRVLAKDEDKEAGEIAGTNLDVEAPILALAQREFTEGDRK